MVDFSYSLGEAKVNSHCSPIYDTLDQVDLLKYCHDAFYYPMPWEVIWIYTGNNDSLGKSCKEYQNKEYCTCATTSPCARWIFFVYLHKKWLSLKGLTSPAPIGLIGFAQHHWYWKLHPQMIELVTKALWDSNREKALGHDLILEVILCSNHLIVLQIEIDNTYSVYKNLSLTLISYKSVWQFT